MTHAQLELFNIGDALPSAPADVPLDLTPFPQLKVFLHSAVLNGTATFWRDGNQLVLAVIVRIANISAIQMHTGAGTAVILFAPEGVHSINDYVNNAQLAQICADVERWMIGDLLSSFKPNVSAYPKLAEVIRRASKLLPQDTLEINGVHVTVHAYDNYKFELPDMTTVIMRILGDGSVDSSSRRATNAVIWNTPTTDADAIRATLKDIEEML